MNREQRLVNEYVARFGRPEFGSFVYVGAPGRVNLIGEHTDYNDGFVLPMTIQHEVNVVAAPRRDREVHVYSINFNESVTLSLDALDQVASVGWANYLRGVLWVLQDEGFSLVGMNAVLYGDVPHGAGLSSSAALEVATLMAVSAVSGFEVEPTQAARFAQRAENEIVGVQCGIMDQFASRLGRQDAALLLDCRSLKYELVPFSDPAVRVVIVNSNVKRGLVDSEYNQRRRECEEGARRLGVPALRDASSEQLVAQADALTPAVRKRSQHVIEENERVVACVDYLRSGNLKEFGEAMYASHVSLRDLFQVSCPELDVLVDIAMGVDGVLGSRMTGAGFGGCTVTLVEERSLGRLQSAIESEYPRRTGLAPDIYVLKAQGGGAFVRALHHA